MQMSAATGRGPDTMLGPYRVLDLSDEKGLICGKMLGDLGADVIKVEPPGGHECRDLGPYYRDLPSGEESLYWFAYNASKRSVTLNLESADGQDLLRRLVPGADFLIESFAPGFLEGMGLGYEALAAINPRLIMTSITPFGQSGPYRDYRSCDLVSMALSGYLYLAGDPDRPPTRISCPQAYLHAGMAAAAGTLVAHYHRQLTGEGQRVDVSIQEACAWIPTDSAIYWEMNRVLEERHGGARVRPTTGARMKRIWRCRDGYVSFDMYGARLARNFMTPLVGWMAEEGAAPPFLMDIEWETFDYFAAPPELVERVAEPIARFFRGRTREELLWGGVARRCCIYPVGSPGDVGASRQLGERGFWVELQHPALGAGVTYPGSCIRASQTVTGPSRRAPRVGEHNVEVYGEVGLSRKDVLTLRRRGVI